MTAPASQCPRLGFFGRVAARWRASRERERWSTESLRVDAEAFEYERHTVDHSDCRAARIAWSEIDRVDAWTKDLFIHDHVIVTVCVGDEHLHVGEDAVGFHRFIEALPDHLPGARAGSEWFHELTRVAFSRELIEVYARAAP